MRIPARACMAVLAWAATGCSAVLTESQIGAAHDFAVASQRYVPLAPGVLEAYGEVRFRRTVLDVSARGLPDANAAAEGASDLENAVEFRARLYARAELVRAALRVLQLYSDGLAGLSGRKDGHRTSLERHARAVDDAVDRYDALAQATVPKFGATAVTAIRAAGGCTRQARRATAIQAYVQAADPAVQKLAGDVEALLSEFAPGGADVFAAELRGLKSAIASTAKAQRALPFDQADALSKAMLQASDARRLADRLQRATRAYAKAHARLREALAARAELPGGLDEVRALEAELGTPSDSSD